MTKKKGVTIILISTLLLGGIGTAITFIFNLHNGDMVLLTIISLLPLVIIGRIGSYVFKRTNQVDV